MQFCPNCSNILHPKEDRDEKLLKYHCRNCPHVELAQTGLIYRHEVQHSLSEKTAVISDVTSDPTLPRTKDVECPFCKNGEAVFFQSTSRDDAEAMTLYFVCTKCGKRFREDTA
ncbi:subunit 9 of DNA-directed RNA polymerase [Chloropicon primus]|uniref:DNA-directed RNA polymerase subunit n=1 Tax=Chloropicon primus TaxID=1764295 RepID=A0A5B8MSH4_9CHLO|nr:subunit 9 of DNA-directed RNA polymerase [Chloropicon primus]UPR02921.1 subunit 9 of DNA-directed RNA polymerase [Chloropicon primus]|mmetsp:Transcript_8669/g.24768  ORF Transcript_8669/g.24768 Transcript_8669/m.24768 type:complete len:114 (+) Transcript_8669:415-756(+)|eukprot:QDZ23708.1 subunit 9 of DNA-directed RNA polymerase [Chloropicon primus]